MFGGLLMERIKVTNRFSNFDTRCIQETQEINQELWKLKGKALATCGIQYKDTII